MNEKNEFARLLQQSGMSIVAAAELLGVTRWTVMNWRAGKNRVPATAMDLMRAAVDTQEVDVPQSAEERAAVLTSIAAHQRATIARLEADLAAERAALEETERRLAEAG